MKLITALAIVGGIAFALVCEIFKSYRIMKIMVMAESFPEIIQGGMGTGVSNWELANSVAKHGQLAVVSGTAIDAILARRLQLGDIGGHMRRALKAFPWQDMAQTILDKYFLKDGKADDAAFKQVPMPVVDMSNASVELLIVSNFVEVFLAKEGHSGVVGINYLQKIQLPTMPSIFGAMLAGVDYVLMGAGIPLAIPGILDSLAAGKATELKIYVDDNPEKVNVTQFFDPKKYCPEFSGELKRPAFLAIISSHIVGKTMIRKASGRVDGFVVENHLAGGHNAPPRSKDEAGKPIFSVKDEANFAQIRDLDRPFWIAGASASPEGLQQAKELGAVGVQLGSVFAYCKESGITPEIRHRVVELYQSGEMEVKTDFEASPTGYPFKLIDIGADDRDKRPCDLGYLREMFIDEKDSVGYRCASESEKMFLKKGGATGVTQGKQCLCNGLLSTVGLGQVRKDSIEPPMVTAGSDFSFLDRLLTEDQVEYSAEDVLTYVLGK